MNSPPTLKLSQLRQRAWTPLAALVLASRGGPPPVHAVSEDFVLTGAALLCLLLLAVPCLLLVH